MDRMFREPVDEIRPEPEDSELPSGERWYEDNEIVDGSWKGTPAGNGPETIDRNVVMPPVGPAVPPGGYPPGPAPTPVTPGYAVPQTQTPSRNNGALIVIAVLLALILVGFAIFGILYFKDRDNKGGDASENALETVREREDEATREAPTETQDAPAQEAYTENAEVTEASTAAEVTPSTVPQTAPPTTAPPTTAPPTTIPLTTAAPTTAASAPTWLEPDPVVLTYGNSYMISYQTPGDAGVNLRQGPGDSYAKLAVLKEGTVIRYTGGKNGGYVSVDYFGTGSKQSGWVLEEYLINDSSGGELYPGFAPAPDVDLARVSYATDSHAGLVLRAESTYYSEKLGVLPEGTVLYLLGGSANGYTKVRTQSGVVGWVLEDYLIK